MTEEERKITEKNKMIGLIHNKSLQQQNSNEDSYSKEQENDNISSEKQDNIVPEEQNHSVQPDEPAQEERQGVSFPDVPTPKSTAYTITESDLTSLYESLEDILSLLNTYDSSVITEITELKKKMEAYAESLLLLQKKTLSEEDIKEVKKIASDITDVYNRLNNIEPSINDMKSRVNSTEELVRSVQETVGVHQQEIKKIQAQNNKMSDEIERNAKELGQQSNRVSLIDDKIEALNKSKEEIAVIVSELENKVDNLEKIVKGAKLDEVEAFRHEMQQEIHAVKEQMTVMDSTLTTLQQSMARVWSIVKTISGKDFDKIEKIVEKPIEETHNNDKENTAEKNNKSLGEQEIISKIMNLGLDIYTDVDKFNDIKTTTVSDRADVLVLSLSKVKSLITKHLFDSKYGNKIVIAVNLPGEQITTDDLFLRHKYPFLRILQYSVPFKLLYSTLLQLKNPYTEKKEQLLERQEELSADEGDDSVDFFRKSGGQDD